MKVNVEDVSSVKKTLHIEVPEETVKKELDDAYRQLKRNAKVKGFRPGKAPRSVLERVYGKEVNADVVSRLVQSSFADAVKETELKIVGNPELDPPKLDPRGAYAYDAVVEVRPELADIEIKGLPMSFSCSRMVVVYSGSSPGPGGLLLSSTSSGSLGKGQKLRLKGFIL